MENTVKVNKNKKTYIGQVVSDKMDKTIVVAITRRVKDSLIGKIISRTTRLKVHDESSTAKMGDLVEIQECRPISRHKAWKLIQVVVSEGSKGVQE